MAATRANGSGRVDKSKIRTMKTGGDSAIDYNDNSGTNEDRGLLDSFNDVALDNRNG